jgi:hypothetical protein
MTYIQNDHYKREQAWFLTRIVRIKKHSSRTGDLVSSRCLRVRIRNKQMGADGSYAIVDVLQAGPRPSVTGWVEVLSRDIQHLRCKSVSYVQKDGEYELFNRDAIDLVEQALEVLEGGE